MPRRRSVLPQQLTLDAFDLLFGLNPDIAAGVPVTSYLFNSLTVALLATALSVPISARPRATRSPDSTSSAAGCFSCFCS